MFTLKICFQNKALTPQNMIGDTIFPTRIVQNFVAYGRGQGVR